MEDTELHRIFQLHKLDDYRKDFEKELAFEALSPAQLREMEYTIYKQIIGDLIKQVNFLMTQVQSQRQFNVSLITLVQDMSNKLDRLEVPPIKVELEDKVTVWNYHRRMSDGPSTEEY